MSENFIYSNKELYKTLAENFSNGLVALFDKDLRIILIEGSEIKEYGYSKEFIEGKLIKNFFPEEKYREIEPKYKNVFKGVYQKYESTIFGRTYLVNLVPVRNENGEIYAGLGIVQNITDIKAVSLALKKSEEELLKSEKLYKTLIDNIPNGTVTLYDKELKILVTGGLGLAELNIKKEDLEGKYLYNIMPKEIYDKLSEAYRSVFEGKVSYMEIANSTKVRIHALNIIPVRNENNEIFAGMVISQNITAYKKAEENLIKSQSELERKVKERTLELNSINKSLKHEIDERKKFEEALRVSEERFRIAAQIATDLIYEWNIKTNHVKWFGDVDKKLKYGFGEFKKTFEFWKSSIHSNDIDRILLAVDKHLKEGTPFSEEYRIKCKDGTYRNWVDIGVAIRDSDGNPYKWIGVTTDITDKKHTEEDLLKSNRELEAFTYSVSHDLRTPLRAIDGFSQILLEDYKDKLDQKGQHALNVISSNARKMHKLINDLLHFSMLNKQNIENTLVDMEKMALSIIDELLRYNFQNGQSNHNVKYRLSNTIYSSYGDPSLIKQVFINLISNALKYSKLNPNPFIEIGCESNNFENIYYVKDNGVGFNMKYKDKLFGLFQRLHNENHFEGTGIGLVIVKQIIERHGGKVWAEGEENIGATFYFSLPKLNKTQS